MLGPSILCVNATILGCSIWPARCFEIAALKSKTFSLISVQKGHDIGAFCSHHSKPE